MRRSILLLVSWLSLASGLTGERTVWADGLLNRMTGALKRQEGAKPAPKAPPPVESYVKVPVVLADVRAMHRPPQQRVTETVETHHAGGGGPRHSAAWLIYLPLLLVPPSFTTVLTVTDQGGPTYRAEFDGERFLRGELTQGTEKTEIGAWSLDRLGRRIVVAIRSTSSARLPIRPQVDLLPAYQAALRDAADATTRGELLLEAVRVLQDEALPLITPVQKLASLSIEQQAELGWLLCLWNQRAALLRMLEALPLRTHWAIALGAIQGADFPDPPLPRALWESLHGSVVSGLCGAAGEQVVRLLGARFSVRGVDVAMLNQKMARDTRLGTVVPQVAPCPLARRAGVRALYDQPLPGAEVRASLAAADLLTPWVLQRIASAEPETHRADVLAALASPQAPHAELLSVLHRVPDPVRTPDEWLLLARAYAAHAIPALRAAILAVFSKSKAGPAAVPSAVDPAKDILRARHHEVGAAQAPAIDLALVVLGERDRALAAARGLGPFQLSSHVSTRLLTADAWSVRTEADLISYGLRLAGCSSDGLVAAHRTAAAAATAVPGAACTAP